MRALADRYEIPIHSHVFKGSVSYALKKFGPARTHHLLGRDVIFAHSNGLAEEEVRALGEAGASIAVVSYTHENILYGVCPVIELLQAGANVTISTDGTAPYCSYDLFREVSRAMWAQWTRLGDMRLLPAGKALRMVTMDAAQALGLGHMLGSLEVGKRADIILVDADKPHLVPDLAAPRLLALYVNGNDVHTTIVDGRILMEGRKVHTVDEGEVLALAREAAERVFSRFDIAPYLQTSNDFWQGWKY
ncbi:MAG: amidohydrolase family protein, partial [Chloroflexi bacterium]|nr:amidohydrolase family protein [Chloroflexota bacterium]